MVIFLAFVIGAVAGLRTMTAPAAVAWAAWLGWAPIAATWAGFLAMPFSVGVFSLLALGEYVADQFPATSSRTVPMQFGARLVSGGFCGAALGAAAGATLPGLLAGVIGAVAGTLGGARARTRLAQGFGRDRPAALIEDAVAILVGLIAAAAV
jgi:uncharacterized membrane protein